MKNRKSVDSGIREPSVQILAPLQIQKDSGEYQSNAERQLGKSEYRLGIK